MTATGLSLTRVGLDNLQSASSSSTLDSWNHWSNHHLQAHTCTGTGLKGRKELFHMPRTVNSTIISSIHFNNSQKFVEDGEEGRIHLALVHENGDAIHN